MLKWISLISIAVGLFLPINISADSLWENAQGPLYGVSPRRITVGDIITIYISESTSAVQQATTSTQKDTSVGTSFLNNWDQVANILGNESVRKESEIQLGGNDSYSGSGQTTRRSQVKAVVTSIVTEVLDSGNLYIVGEHKVKVNNEVEIVRVSGIVRPQDVSAANGVSSFQIAKAEISVNGMGVVGAKQAPGVLGKMFNWMF